MAVTLHPENPSLPRWQAGRAGRVRLRAGMWLRSDVGIGVAVCAAYLAVAILFTWPLAPHLNDGVTSAIDPVDSIWRIGWGQHQLLHDPPHLFDGNVFYPYTGTYLFDGMELGAAILTLPLAALAMPPLALYNCAVLLSLALSGAAMYALARRLGAVSVAAFIAGAIYAFAPMHMDRIGHVAFLSTMGFPLILLFLDRVVAAPRPRARDTALLAACLVMQALATQYYAIYLAVLVPLYLGVMLLRRPEARRWAVWAHLAVAGAVALLVVAPVALAYRAVQIMYGVERTYGQVTYYSASLANFITADGRNRFWGTITAPLRDLGTYTFERNMFPGLVALVFAGIGLWVGRRRAWEQFLGALVVAGGILALGPELRLTPETKSLLLRHLPYDIFYWHVPGFDSMRAPGRFGLLFLLGIAGLAATGATALLTRLDALPRLSRLRPRRAALSTVAACVLLAGLGGEYLNHPLQIVPLESGAAVPPVYRWLATEPDARVLELPLVIPDHAREQQLAARQQYFSLVYLHPLVNGNANVLPKGYKALVLDMQRFPSPRTVALAQGLGITDVVVHREEFSEADRAALDRRLGAEMPGLTLAQRFGETWVYHVAPSPSLARLAATIEPGASVLLSREDPLGTGAYMAMLGHVLRDHPLAARLRVSFGEEFSNPEPGQQYAYALLYRDEDPAAAGFPATTLVWQDDTARAYRITAP